MPRAAQLLTAAALTCLALQGGCVRASASPDKPGDADGGEVNEEGAKGVATLSAAASEPEPDPEQLAAGVPYLRYRVDVSDSPARGPADAPVTIVMFSDFECPFCSESYATLTQLQAEYPEQIRFVYKSLPLAKHPNALEAALVGHSALAQGKFWEFHDLVFRGENIEPETLAGYVQTLGLDAARVEQELERLTHAPALRRDLRAARRLRLTSTPIFFINGRKLTGAKPRRIFEHHIEQELELAAHLVADQGVPAAELYDYATQWGYTQIVYADAPPELDEDKVYPVPITGSPARGPADAPITIVAFSDFQCPFCARGHETMEQLAELYPGQLRFVFKHFPLPGHPLGALASRASFAAADVGRFWEFHDAVFATGARYEPDELVDIAYALGVPRPALEEAMTTELNDVRINADVQLGMKLMITGTPAYFINGRPIVGVRPLMDLRLLIAEELERAEQARAQGVPPAKLYDHLVGL